MVEAGEACVASTIPLWHKTTTGSLAHGGLAPADRITARAGGPSSKIGIDADVPD